MYIHAGTQERARWRKAAKGTRWLRVEWRDEIQVDVPRYSAGLANRPDRHWVISRRHVDSSSPEPNQWKKHHPKLNSPLRLMHCHHPAVPLSWNTTHPHHFLLPSIHFLLHPSASDAISTFTDVYGRHKMKKKLSSPLDTLQSSTKYLFKTNQSTCTAPWKQKMRGCINLEADLLSLNLSFLRIA